MSEAPRLPHGIDTTRHSLADNPTIFGMILRKEIPADIVYEDENVLAFKDIEPQAKIHVLIIPKQHVTCARCLTNDDAQLLSKLFAAANEVAEKLGVLESGYRLITNAGHDGNQSVPHLHIHLLAGEPLGGF